MREVDTVDRGFYRAMLVSAEGVLPAEVSGRRGCNRMQLGYYWLAT